MIRDTFETTPVPRSTDVQIAQDLVTGTQRVLSSGPKSNSHLGSSKSVFFHSILLIVYSSLAFMHPDILPEV